VFKIISIPGFILPLLLPKHLQNILNAMLWSPGSIRDGAVVDLRLLSQALKQRALIARSLEGIHEQRLSLEPFSRTIDIVASGLLTLLIDKKDNIIQILPGLDVIQASNNNREL
jgi:hypothetical protein